MKEATFITPDGDTKVCNISDDVKLDYKCLVSNCRNELSIEEDHRIKIFREGEEEALNPSSDIQSGDKYFVLQQQYNKEKTCTLHKVLISRELMFLNICTTYNSYNINTDKSKSHMYNNIKELIDEGASIESILLKNESSIENIVPYIVSHNDIQLLKLLLNNGLDIDSPIIKTNFIERKNSIFNNSSVSYYNDDIFDVFVAYKINLRYHFDVKSVTSIRNLAHEHTLLAYAISEKIVDLNMLIPPHNSALYYYVYNLQKFLKKYNLTVDYNLPAEDGTTFLCREPICYCGDQVFKLRLKSYPLIDINRKYYITSDKHKETTRFGDTLLHMLCRDERINFIKIQLLLDKGAKLIDNDDFETPINVVIKRPYSKNQHKLLNMLEEHFDYPITQIPTKLNKLKKKRRNLNKNSLI